MVIYGKQVCIYALQKHGNLVKRVYIAKKGILPQELLNQYKESVTFLEEKWAQKMSKNGNHQGILLEMEDFVQTPLSKMKQGKFLVVLDGLSDVGNIGAVVRSAYALGADGVIASRVKSLNFEGIARTSSGSLLSMPFFIHDNILDVFHELSDVGFKLYGASRDGEDIDTLSFSDKRVLVLGSEGDGISKRALSKLDKIVSIQMSHEFDSLNVSAAASILIHRMGK
ncbi:MAG: RNA methyltransferase [Sulfurovum sp. AS07-7]|nr:MAG: RNA methyltransferase [Sulfurovum sp. AS07-7]